MQRPPVVHQSTLDFLRGLAAVYVLCNHARGLFYMGGQKLLTHGATPMDMLGVAVMQITRLGAEFVILFFVLSGFAMRHSIAHTPDRWRFYLRRFVRIYPPYLSAILLALFVAALFGNPTVRNIMPGLLFYTEANSDPTPQFWSLVYEVIFYILCPLLLISNRTVRWTLGLGAVFTLVTLLIVGPLLNPWKSILANFAGNELLFFAAGAMAYDHLDRVPVIRARALAVVSAAAFILAYVAKYGLDGSNVISNLIMVGWTVLLIRNLPARLAESRWANLGSFSYSIYLYHYAVLFVIASWLRTKGIEPMGIRNPFSWMLTVPVALAVSYGLYRLVEKPCVDLLKRMRQPSSTVRPAT